MVLAPVPPFAAPIVTIEPPRASALSCSSLRLRTAVRTVFVQLSADVTRAATSS